MTHKWLSLMVSGILFLLAAAPALSQEPAPARILDDIKDFGSDPDGDGLFEDLILKVPVQVDLADIYTLRAQLFQPNSTGPLSRAELRTYLEIGEQSVALVFGSQQLSTIKGEQPLTVQLMLSDSSQKAIDTQTYVSGPYAGSRFEGLPGLRILEFTDRIIENPEDFDGNGKYEYLNISFEMRNLTSALLKVSGALDDIVAGFGAIRAFSKESGTGWAELQFPGGAILERGAPGPYSVSIHVSADNGLEVVREFWTGAYNATDFEPAEPPVAFTGTGTDAGIDTDGDGLFELLQVSAQVSISLEGLYYFKAAFEIPGKLINRPLETVLRASSSIQFSEEGTAGITFNFSGPELRLLQLDGPYTISLNGFSERVLAGANWTYRTSAYRSSQFDEPRLPARFTGTAGEEALDRDGNGLFNALVLSMAVEVFVAGSYQLAGALFSDERFVALSGGRFDLKAGPARVNLKFDGTTISEAGFDGPYKAVLYLSRISKETPGSGGEGSELPGIGSYLPPDKLVLLTKPYRAGEFEKKRESGTPLPLPEEPEMSVGGDFYTTRAPRISVEVNRSVPDLFFYYTLDNGRSARFRLTFSRLIAYADASGNGVFDPGEERLQGILSLASWEAGKVEFSENGGGGKTVLYNLSALLDLTAENGTTGTERPQATIPKWGRMTFSFTLTSKNIDFTEPAEFTLRGGTEMKIDILIEPLRQLPAEISGLVLKHFLSDERGQNYFRTYEGDQTRLFQPGLEGANGSFFHPAETVLQKIALIAEGGKEHGYYSWLSGVKVGKKDGSSAWMPVNLTYSTDGRQMTLFLDYPLPAGTVSLLHDPTVGVNETNAPVNPAVSLETLFNPMLYVLAIAVAAAIVVVLRRSQKPGDQ